MSMSVSLGGKAVPFGKGGDAKSTKKTTTTKKKPKPQQKNLSKYYDDEGVGLL